MHQAEGTSPAVMEVYVFVVKRKPSASRLSQVRPSARVSCKSPPVASVDMMCDRAGSRFTRPICLAGAPRMLSLAPSSFPSSPFHSFTIFPCLLLFLSSLFYFSSSVYLMSG